MQREHTQVSMCVREKDGERMFRQFLFCCGIARVSIMMRLARLLPTRAAPSTFRRGLSGGTLSDGVVVITANGLDDTPKRSTNLVIIKYSLLI
jgi:hypothetical protein